MTRQTIVQQHTDDISNIRLCPGNLLWPVQCKVWPFSDAVPEALKEKVLSVLNACIVQCQQPHTSSVLAEGTWVYDW